MLSKYDKISYTQEFDRLKEFTVIEHRVIEHTVSQQFRHSGINIRTTKGIAAILSFSFDLENKVISK